ncbi:V-type proton ATPase subunit c1-like protein [Cinnamomum micranthum f. kanehirae]|uniref:V-type proton ATPase proteolipid subunit n=1 Tax=Cinnamomum micranthum f. kanehirae TaxID=337451 RepID=A0A3S3QPG1_9MAGN|nr:V-type proton ATPase subunit c1-like protein [Cinnamomum micranthum f. kanehirae]
MFDKTTKSTKSDRRERDNRGEENLNHLFYNIKFGGMGATYGTTKSVGMASMGFMRLELVMKSIVPVVIAGVLGIYGLIIAVIISTGINPKAKSYYLFDGYANLSSGLSCGLVGLATRMAIGIVVVLVPGNGSKQDISNYIKDVQMISFTRDFRQR